MKPGSLALALPVLLSPASAPVGPQDSPRRAEDALLDKHATALRAMVAGPADAARPKVLILGTFHFENPGRDAYKPKYTFALSSEEGQRQLAELLAVTAGREPQHLRERRASVHA